MSVVLIDARDSFVHIIAGYFQRLGVRADVVRPDQQDAAAAITDLRPDALVLGPGPGHPAASCHVPLLTRHLGRTPLLGVCLGHQALGAHFGWPVVAAPRPAHGKQSRITHDGTGLFAGIESPMLVARYHSLVLRPNDGGLRPVAHSEDGTVMAVAAPGQRAWGVQFHPESYGTNDGQQVIRNFCRLAGVRARPESGTDQPAIRTVEVASQ